MSKKQSENMKNNFLSIADFPHMIGQWDYGRNTVDPGKIPPGTVRKFFWLCSLNHSFEDSANHRKSGRGCPFCSGKRVMQGFNDLAHLYPKLKKEWNYDKNSDSPDNITVSSNKKVWWRCSKGHEWEAKIYSRTKNGSACPFCSGREAIEGENDLDSQYPIIAREWHPTKNAALKPNKVKSKSSRKVWWICSKGHEWQATPANRILSGTNCPICSSELRSSFPEQTILFYVSKIFSDATSRFIIDNKKTEIDIYIASLKIGIEYNGIYFHKDPVRDEKKLNYINQMGIKLFRVIETNEKLEDFNDDDIPVRYPVRFANLDESISELLNKLSKYTGRRSDSVLVDSEADRLEIYSSYLSMVKTNSLEVTHPSVAQKWDYNKNKPLSPDQFSSGSQRKFWWVCVHGHSYEDSISHQTSGRGCAICSNRNIIKGINDLATLNHNLIKEWNFKKNKILPSEVSIKSNKKVWWVCTKGHEWQSTIHHRSNGGSCPFCGGRYAIENETDLASTFPLLFKNIHPTKNLDVDFSKVKPGRQQ